MSFRTCHRTQNKSQPEVLRDCMVAGVGLGHVPDPLFLQEKSGIFSCRSIGANMGQTIEQQVPARI